MNIPSARPFFAKEDIKAISAQIESILSSGQLVLGKNTEQFEQLFKEYCGTKHAIAVSSCTAALEICLRYFNVDNYEVIVPTNTFITTCNAVLFSGGKLVLADIKADTLCLDPADLLKKVTPETRGVIMVHIAGLPCPDTEEIKTICKERNLFLIEDVAHAHGATIKGQKTGSFGDSGCFSFYPTKVMTTGTGGMITTNDDKLAEYARCLRRYGTSKTLENVIYLGNDWLMDEINAVLGISQLKVLDSNIVRRNEIANKYNSELIKIEKVKLFKVPKNFRHSYYKYPIMLSASINKRKMISKMKSAGIALGSIYDPPCHLQPVYKQRFGFTRGMFPVAEEILERTVCLPIFPQITQEEINYVLESLDASLKMSL